MTMNIVVSNLQNKAFPSSTVVSSFKKVNDAVEHTILEEENKNTNIGITQIKICHFCELCKECLLHRELIVNVIYVNLMATQIKE